MTLFHYIIFCCLLVLVWCYGEDFSDGYHYHRAFPQDVMVDVINNFGLALLEAHNEGNDNNIALSPYGATSVLVAVGEGIRGFAVKEIHEATRIPIDISVVRVGLRDIHRHLKSYFIPKEGFLAGLTLSNEKVPLTPRYEEILRFYGYDLESFNSALYSDAFLPPSTIPINYTTTTVTAPSKSQTMLENNDISITTLESRTEANNHAYNTMTTEVYDVTTPLLLTKKHPAQISENNTENKTNTVNDVAEGTTSFQSTFSTEPTSSPATITVSKSTTEQLTTESSNNFDSNSYSNTSTVAVMLSTDKPNIIVEVTTITPFTTTVKDAEPLTTNTLEEMGTSPVLAESTETTPTVITMTPFTTTVKDSEPLTTKKSILEEMVTSPMLSESTGATNAVTTMTSFTTTVKDAGPLTTKETTSEEMGTSTMLEKSTETTKTITTMTPFTTTVRDPEPLTTKKNNLDGMETSPTLSESTESTKAVTMTPFTTTVKVTESITTKKTTLEEMETSLMLAQTTETTKIALSKGNVSDESDSIVSTLESTTTSKYESALELSDMLEENASELPVLMTFTTTNIDVEVISVPTTPTNTTDDFQLIDSNKIQNAENVINSSIEQTLAAVPSNSTNYNENIQSTMSSTTDLSDNESTADEDNSTEDIVITTSVTHSISKVTTTYETSSWTSINFPQSGEETTTGNVITETESSETLQAESTEDANNPVNYTTIIIPESIAMKEGVTNSTELTKGIDAKRAARSIIDYVIARYYDSFPRRHYNDRSYHPEEKLSFLVYGKFRETNINFMTYDAVLPVAYIPIIDAMALSFPLDSKEYYLLLLLPSNENGIDELIYNLKQRTNLRSIIRSLTYSHVKAIIPSFMLKGYVLLTHTLRKLGIRRIFEPRHTDFSLMTKEKDIYVTNIEQAVTVTIRNYIDPDNLQNYRNLQQHRPIEFKADHPFLYFVMDTDIHVNLMAGKIVNPLNSRIR